jgi:serine/threonine-protein kinase
MGDFAAKPDPLVGMRFGKGALLVVKKLGSGGMGSVYLGRDDKHDRMVALKFLDLGNASPDATERFKREGKLFGALRHPNLVRVLGFGRESGRTYIVSEFIDGKNLHQLLKVNGPFKVDDALRITRDVAIGLCEVHKAHVVHRDLKPENIMISERDQVVKVVDFGIAKDLAASQAYTKQGCYLGTPAYSAPEQIKGLAIDRRADIFSLGVILYELLAAQVAFQGKETTEVLDATISDEPMPLTELNQNVIGPVARLIQRMIQKSPRRRPADMTEVLAEIEQVRAALAKGYSAEEQRGIATWLQRVFRWK